VAVNRGIISADTLHSHPIAAIEDRQTSARILIPFSYIPTCLGAPSDNPPEFNGFVPLRLDVLNSLLYYYSNGAWLSLAGGDITPDLSLAYLFEDGTAMLFEDGSQMQWGGV
jgi:hypothetical protein